MCPVQFFQGHLSPSQFVVTEWPLKHTIPPFWRMVIDMRFDVIIVIGSPGHFSKVSISKLLYTIAYLLYPYSRAQTYLNKITTSAWAPNQFSKTQAVVFLNLKFIASFCRTFCSFFSIHVCCSTWEVEETFVLNVYQIRGLLFCLVSTSNCQVYNFTAKNVLNLYHYASQTSIYM